MGEHMSSLQLSSLLLSLVAEAVSPKLEFFVTLSKQHIDDFQLVDFREAIQWYSKDPQDSHGKGYVVSLGQ